MSEKSVQVVQVPKPDANIVIQINNVKKIYRMGKERILAVDGVSFEINKGEFCCLLGTSGSGKSTLLNLMAGIERCTSGSIIIKGKNIRRMSEKNLAKFRQRYLGFVFQSYNLINSMTALENVELPLVFKRIRPKRRKRLAREMLTQVGLGSRLRHKPKEMSGGQQQRVGIARAFVAKPEIVFADEPTGNLDTKTTMEVMNLIKKIAKENHQTIVMVTHDPRLASFADKIIHILDGQIQEIEICDHPQEENVQEEKAQEKNGQENENESLENDKEVVIETTQDTASETATVQAADLDQTQEESIEETVNDTVKETAVSEEQYKNQEVTNEVLMKEEG